MKVIKDTGGMEKIHLAFYTDEYEKEETSERSRGLLAARRAGLRVELPRAAARPHVRQHLQQARVTRSSEPRVSERANVARSLTRGSDEPTPFL